MLAYILSNYRPGDTIEVTCSEGTIQGEIEYLNYNYIVLRQPNGKICGIAAADIRTFRAECPVPLTPTVKPATQPPAEEPETENKEGDAGNEDSYSSRTDTQTKGYAPEATPKVVGRIDLKQLHAIDPRYGKRNYFPTEQPQEEKADGNADSTYRNSYNDTRAPRNNWRTGEGRTYTTPFVAARGRITYYNPDKRFGFIHDYREDADLYFNVQSVIDSRLYDQLYKGTKVVYTIGRNHQGFVAQYIHLPHSVEDLLMMAEDLFDARHYGPAQGVIDHILEVVPDDEKALQLRDDIKEMAPTPTLTATTAQLTAQFPLYAQAKKYYLAKDADKAEEYYLKAIEAGEKAESSVKDLVTLYVSRYKQAEDPEEKENCRKKAIDFLEAHKNLLPDNLTTKQFLALNYYLSIQEYEKFIALVDEILTDPSIAATLSKRAFYMWQKGIALNKMGRTEEALAVVDKELALSPAHTQLRRLREIILHPEQQTEAGENEESQETSAPEGEQPAAADNDDNEKGEKPSSWWNSLNTAW